MYGISSLNSSDFPNQNLRQSFPIESPPRDGSVTVGSEAAMNALIKPTKAKLAKGDDEENMPQVGDYGDSLCSKSLQYPAIYGFVYRVSHHLSN